MDDIRTHPLLNEDQLRVSRFIGELPQPAAHADGLYITDRGQHLFYRSMILWNRRIYARAIVKGRKDVIRFSSDPRYKGPWHAIDTIVDGETGERIVLQGCTATHEYVKRWREGRLRCEYILIYNANNTRTQMPYCRAIELACVPADVVATPNETDTHAAILDKVASLERDLAATVDPIAPSEPNGKGGGDNE